MRFAGIILSIAVFILFCVLVGVAEFLWQPWFLLGVIVLSKAALLGAYSLEEHKRACLAFWSSSADEDSKKLAAEYFMTLKTTLIGAGWTTTVFGSIAVLAGGTPPDVVSFSLSFSGIGYGVFFAYAIVYPLARSFRS